LLDELELTEQITVSMHNTKQKMSLQATDAVKKNEKVGKFWSG